METTGSVLKTVGDVLDTAEKYTSAFNDFLADVRDRASDGSVRLMAQYLSKFRRHLRETLACFSAADLSHIRSLPLKTGGSEFVVDRCFSGRFVAATAEPAELLGHGVELVEALVSLYDWIDAQDISPDARVLIKDLLSKGELALSDLKKL